MRKTESGIKFFLLLVLLLLVAAVEIAWGPVSIPISKVVPKYWEYMHGSRDTQAVVIGAIRLPRMAAAGLVGAGLASTGAVLQAVFRNPMADPAIIGVSSGGSLGAVLMISTGLGAVYGWLTPVGAFVGGLVVLLIIYRLGTVSGKTVVHTLLLSGVAVSSFCGALVTFILSLSPLETMKQILFWLMGGLDGSTWEQVWILLVFVVVGMAAFLSQAQALDILSIGEEQAEGVGVHSQQVKLVILTAAGLVVGACVSVSGLIGFVGLIVPHLARIWIGPKHGLLILASALGGAALLTLSDVAARMLLQPIELNVGIVTSCLGAPFFLYLLRRQYASDRRR